MTHTLLIADLHLTPNEIKKTQLFVKFCQEQAIKADQLFILGDLFNTWLGDDLSCSAYSSIISTLKTLGKTTKIFIAKGNRDFLLGKEFVRQTNCTLLKTPYLLQTNNKSYVLIHGDELCTDDKQYQRLKSLLQNPITKFVFQRLPVKTRINLGNQLRQKSLSVQQHRAHEITDINQQTTDELMQKYTDADLIHGHTHKPKIHRNNKYTRYVLGDWNADTGNAIEIVEQVNYLEIR